MRREDVMLGQRVMVVATHFAGKGGVVLRDAVHARGDFIVQVGDLHIGLFSYEFESLAKRPLLPAPDSSSCAPVRETSLRDDLSGLTHHELERRAQDAAERRLARCSELLLDDAEARDDVPSEDEPFAPFCGCDTCVAREVLDAAWPYVVELARRLERGAST